MKKLNLLVAAAIVTAIFFVAPMSANDIVLNGNTFSSQTSPSINRAELDSTGYNYEIKGTNYPIYISKNGKAFIIRVSQKSGNEYRYYLPDTIAVTIQQRKEK